MDSVVWLRVALVFVPLRRPTSDAKSDAKVYTGRQKALTEIAVLVAWDLKARRAGLPLAKLLGADRDSVCSYNTSGGFLSSSVDEVMESAAAALARGIVGIKLKVGHPEAAVDLERVETARTPPGRHVRREPLFDERPELRDGRMLVPTRAGLGLTLSEQSARWTARAAEFGTRP